MSAGNWTALGTMLLFSATLLGATFVLLELRGGNKDVREANSRAKKQATVNFYTQTLERRINWQSDLPSDRDSSAVDLMIRDLIGSPQDKEKKARKAAIHSYLAYWELTAVAIRHDVFDEELFKDILMTRFLQVEQNYRPFVKAARAELGDSGTQLYVQLEKLAAEWRDPAPSQRN
jgi:uncharacterized protein DUF4760